MKWLLCPILGHRWVAVPADSRFHFHMYVCRWCGDALFA